MALDPERLRQGLEDYRKSLSQQRDRLAGNFSELQGAFDALWQEYSGNMAEEFRNRWGQTAEWFEHYMDTVNRLERFLGERSDELRHL